MKMMDAGQGAKTLCVQDEAIAEKIPCILDIEAFCWHENKYLL